MTRINVGIRPRELCRQHLVAEHREIIRIPNLLKARLGKYNSIDYTKIPKSFTLGTGHVLFFYDKMLYLKKRYEELYEEMIKRGYTTTYMGGAFDNIDDVYMNDYIETEQDRDIIVERIKERILNMKQVADFSHIKN